MPPSLSPLSEDDTFVAVPPPYFRPAQPPISRVKLDYGQHYLRKKGNTSARENGLRYEEKISQRLLVLFPQIFLQPGVEFRDNSGSRVCRPDGLLLLASRTVIFEIKSHNMPEAWWQLEKLYRPVLQAWNPKLPVMTVEIVHSFDPSIPCAATPKLVQPQDLFAHVGGGNVADFGVVPWP